MSDFLQMLIQILGLAANLLITVIIVQFILGLLMAFNVVSPSNQFVSGLYDALNTLLDPILRPIRKIMPDTGAIDLSPIVLIFGINVLMIMLNTLQQQV